MAHYLDVYHEDAIVAENTIRGEEPDLSFPPSFAEARARLPAPWLGGARGEAATGAYWKSMELLFRNIKRATKASGFKKPYADAAFNENFFMCVVCARGCEMRSATVLERARRRTASERHRLRRSAALRAIAIVLAAPNGACVFARTCMPLERRASAYI